MPETMKEKDNFQRSPYLEDHEGDPVKWNIWGDDLFEYSKKEDRPLFITIGYSTCHWCHVMQSESFRDEEVSKILNENYIPVVVDREERPDIDSFYMGVSQAINGSGGWPLNVIAMPDGRPFQVFTYVPPRDSGGSGGLVGILSAISEIWKNERGRIIEAADQVTSIVLSPEKELEGDVRFEDSIETLQSMYDRKNGGFGIQPKFPNFPYLLFLMNYMRSKRIKSLAYMVEKTLKNIRNGGIYDQVGYGLHRYSTDAEWKIPHFEKMLYDQAMAILAYTQYFRLSGETSFLDVAGEVVESVNRDMKNSDGFYVSGLDADFKGKEGEYYTWTEDELESKLGKEVAKQVEEAYYFDRDLDNRIVLRRREIFNVSSEKLNSLRELNGRLLSVRKERGEPKKDDKAILAWNCMLLSSFVEYSLCKSGQGLDEIVASSRKIIDEFSTRDGLYRTIRNGTKGVEGLLEDYAYYALLMLDLFEATGENLFLSQAIEKVSLARKKFLDSGKGGFYSGEERAGKLILSNKDRLDIIYPSGESVLYLVLEKLFLVTGAEEYREMSESIIRSRKNELLRNPLSSVFLLSSLLFKGKMKKIEVPDHLKEDFLDQFGKSFLPEVIATSGADNFQVCDDKSCQYTGKDPNEALKYLLDNK